MLASETKFVVKVILKRIFEAERSDPSVLLIKTDQFVQNYFQSRYAMAVAIDQLPRSTPHTKRWKGAIGRSQDGSPVSSSFHYNCNKHDDALSIKYDLIYFFFDIAFSFYCT